jgi:predicted nuclease of predicted toxin-antitoxin system
MKLLLDENISYRVLKIILKYFPESIHVNEIKRQPLTDWDIFIHARENHYVLVTFDEDFYELQLLRGSPPKIIWLRLGNSNNLKIANKLLDARAEIEIYQ